MHQNLQHAVSSLRLCISNHENTISYHKTELVHAQVRLFLSSPPHLLSPLSQSLRAKKRLPRLPFPPTDKVVFFFLYCIWVILWSAFSKSSPPPILHLFASLLSLTEIRMRAHRLSGQSQSAGEFAAPKGHSNRAGNRATRSTQTRSRSATRRIARQGFQRSFFFFLSLSFHPHSIPPGCCQFETQHSRSQTKR